MTMEMVLAVSIFFVFCGRTVLGRMIVLFIGRSRLIFRSPDNTLIMGPRSEGTGVFHSLAISSVTSTPGSIANGT